MTRKFNIGKGIEAEANTKELFSDKKFEILYIAEKHTCRTVS